MGDILAIEEGMTIPCDGLLLLATDEGIDVNESAYYGINSVKRKDTRNDRFLLSGSEVYKGAGRMLACCVG